MSALIASKVAHNVIQLTRSTNHKTSKRTNATNGLGRRFNTLYPVLAAEILDQYADKEYFTRDYIARSKVLKQFSMSYRIQLVSQVISRMLAIGKIIRINHTDLAVTSPKSTRIARQRKVSKEISYSSKYTTSAADQLLKIRTPKRFDRKWLSDTLDCLDKFQEQTRMNYAGRIINDLVMRGIIIEYSGFEYSVNK